FFTHMKIFAERKVEQVTWTRKVPSELVDPQILGFIDQASGEYAANYPPSSMSDIARLLQAAQACYESRTRKERKPSTWRESIEKKVQLNKTNKDLISRYTKGDALPPRELSDARKCMRDLNLILDNKRDAMEALSILEERVRVYQSKLEGSEKRTQFRRDNRTFELYRGRFYKQLTGEKAVEYSVPTEDIAGFWGGMWNRREGDEQAYDEYLDTWVPDAKAQNTFPSLLEFQEVVKFLPCWKAAGPDGIYSFFTVCSKKNA
ncbi:hypothetical protein PAPHI01_2813, partial [Pancytospora philotis]